MEDPELFIRPDGLPMAFLMGHKGLEGKEVKKMVEERGGVVCLRPTLAYRDNIIRLVVEGEVSLRRDQDIFDHKYVLDCVRDDNILPNLLDYRINSPFSILQHYDPIDILLGYKRWRDIPEVEGDKVSDIEDFVEDEVPMSHIQSNQSVFKLFRTPYSKKQEQEIINVLVKLSAYKMVKGNSIWQRMEEQGVCKRARTWQSMKEHFRKKIIHKIHSFGLSWKQVRKFRAAFGLDEEHSSDDDTDKEEEIIEQTERKLSEDVKKTRFKPRRTSSPVEPPPKKYEEKNETECSDSESIIDEIVIPHREDEELQQEAVEPDLPRKRKLLSTNESYLDPDTEQEAVEQNLPIKRKRKLFSTNESYLDPDTEGQE